MAKRKSIAGKQDPDVFKAVSTALDKLFKTHGDGVATCVNRYMRIRGQTRQKKRRIAKLESELKELKELAG